MLLLLTSRSFSCPATFTGWLTQGGCYAWQNEGGKKKSKNKVEQADGASHIKRCLSRRTWVLSEIGEKGHMSPRTGTMQSSRMLSGALLCALLLLSAGAAGAGAQGLLDAESEEELSPRALRDFYPKGPNLTSEKQLVSPCKNPDIKIFLRNFHLKFLHINFHLSPIKNKTA